MMKVSACFLLNLKAYGLYIDIESELAQYKSCKIPLEFSLIHTGRKSIKQCWLAVDDFAHLLQYIANDKASPMAPFALSRCHIDHVLGDIGMAMTSAENLSEALAILCQFQHHLFEGFSLRLAQDDELCLLSFSYLPTKDKQLCSLVEYILSMLINVLNTSVEGGFFAYKIYFQHNSQEQLEAYNTYYPCIFEFKHSENGFLFPSFLLKRSMRFTNNQSNHFFLENLNKIDGFNLESSLVKEIEEIILSFYFSNKTVSLSAVAEHMQMGERSLQRKLRNLELSFSKIDQRVRYQFYLKLLDENCDMAVVSERLGFSELSSFNRWLKSITLRNNTFSVVA